LGLLCKENSVATTLANEWVKLDPIIRKRTAKGELDQVENTRNFAQNASADQLLPQLQMVVQE
jgi:hypothetical protein